MTKRPVLVLAGLALLGGLVACQRPGGGDSPLLKFDGQWTPSPPAAEADGLAVPESWRGIGEIGNLRGKDGTEDSVLTKTFACPRPDDGTGDECELTLELVFEPKDDEELEIGTRARKGGALTRWIVKRARQPRPGQQALQYRIGVSSCDRVEVRVRIKEGATRNLQSYGKARIIGAICKPSAVTERVEGSDDELAPLNPDD